MSEAANIDVSPSRRHIIKRPRLTNLLDETKARCILLVAPAGYGKTTLAREWTADLGPSKVWYATPPTASDPVSLVSSLVASAESVAPEFGRRLLHHLRNIRGSSLPKGKLAELLRKDCEGWPESVWLVVDDYHYCSGAKISESVFEEIFRSRRVPLLITTRRRPGWMTARDLLYGQALEIGTNLLAMDDQETSNALAAAHAYAIPGLLALTNGWPALIGLAALLPPSKLLPEGPLPATLYDYFADEVFAALDEQLRDGLTKIAFAPRIDVRLAEALLGKQQGRRVLKQGERLGLITETIHGPPVLHPLLRRFLEGRLLHDDPSSAHEIVHRVIGWYIENTRWDDAFAVISRHAADAELADLLAQATHPLLAEGRIDSVNQWLQLAAKARVTGPVVDLAEAEIAFRHGHHHEAEILASRAAEALGTRHRLYPRALIRAGQSAQFDDRPAAALAYQNRARANSTTVTDRWDATWGSFVASLLLEDDDLGVHLKALHELPNTTIDNLLRLKCASYNYAQLAGDLLPVMRDLRDVWPLVHRCSDPVIATSFLNACAFGHIQTAQYEIATAAANDEMSWGQDFGLAFVRPHALCNLARAELGKYRFAEAEALVEEVQLQAERLGDVHNQMEAFVIRACSRIYQGDYVGALKLTSDHWERLPTTAQVGEYLAVRALALACAENPGQASEFVSYSLRTTKRLPVVILNMFTGAIIALKQQRDDAPRLAIESFNAMRHSGMIDSFVTAYRASPALLMLTQSVVEDDPELTAEVNAIVERAPNVIEKMHLGDNKPLERLLTPRETEVYDLLAKGYSNREIATELFISEVTAKVHVRKILKKLGVRSRTEAVIQRFAST